MAKIVKVKASKRNGKIVKAHIRNVKGGTTKGSMPRGLSSDLLKYRKLYHDAYSVVQGNTMAASDHKDYMLKKYGEGIRKHLDEAVNKAESHIKRTKKAWSNFYNK